MTGDWEFDVLDYPKEHQRTDHKDFFRVYVAPGVLKLLGLEKGDPCSLQVSGSSVGIVLVWEMNKGVKTRELQIPKYLQSLYEVGHRAKVSLCKIHPQLPDVKSVALYEVASNESKINIPTLRREDYSHWEWLIGYELYRAETISPCMVFEGIVAIGQKRSFRIKAVNGSPDVSPRRFNQSCKVEIVNDEALGGSDATHISGKGLTLSKDGLGGLEAQIEKLNKEVATFGKFENTMPMPPSSPQFKNGIILYGPSGTGKSLLLRKIREAGWRSVFDIGPELLNNPRISEKKSAIRKIFADALNLQPSVIILDKLDRLERLSNNDGSHTAVTEVLRQEMELLGDSHTLVVAATRSLTGVDQELRSLRGFSLEVEVPVPDMRARTSILKALSGLPIHEDNSRLDAIASRTHGFVGADLARLIDVAANEARQRDEASGSDEANNARMSKFSLEQIKAEDFDLAFLKVQPSAMREVFVEIHETRWNDIGGQDEVKEILHQAIIWPTKYSEHFKALAIEPNKGLLLYGPPGCSKTMTARAAATESGYNFIAVKGAELLNMYVGESERKIREYFSLARSVRPSILFFDEIDAIGTARSDGLHSGLNIVTTLLNELDGIEDLKGVFVLAATNRPDTIDPALTRAGRLDTMLYVGPPDLKARRQILEKRLRKMPVGEELNASALAEATDGYSGAEIMRLCHGAALAAIKDCEVEQLQGVYQLPKVGRKHFDMAMRNVHKVITPQMLAFFEDFRASNGSQRF